MKKLFNNFKIILLFLSCLLSSNIFAQEMNIYCLCSSGTSQAYIKTKITKNKETLKNVCDATCRSVTAYATTT